MATILYPNMSVGHTLGVSFTGLLFNMALYGAACIQFMYYLGKGRSPSDSWQLPVFVTALWILCTIQAVLAACQMYRWMIAGFGDTYVMEHAAGMINFEITVTVLVAFSVRGFYILRLWKLSGKNWFVVIPIFLASLTYLALGLNIAALEFKAWKIDILVTYTAQLAVDLIAAVLCDLMISSALAYYLSRRAGEHRSDSMIMRLIVWSVNISVLTALVELLVLITSVTMPRKFYFLAIHFVVAQVYMNSFMMIINLRSHVCNSPPEQAKSEEDGNMFTTHLDLNRWGPLPNNRTFDSADAANDEVMAEVGMSSCRGSTLVSDRARPESVETRGRKGSDASDV